MNRRSFLKLSAVTAASLSPVARIGAALGVTGVTSTQLNASASFNDYKALVVCFFDGGNDAMNMFPPSGATAHDQYTVVRGSSTNQTENLNIALTDLSNTNFNIDEDGHFVKLDGVNHPYYDEPQDGDSLSASAKRSYKIGMYHTTETTNNGNGTYTSTDTATGLGINSMMPEIAAMYKKGTVSIVSNVGTLVKPTTQAQIEDGTAKLPVFLFAHNHQTRAVFTAQAEQLGATGWAGRLADNWNINDPVGLNLSYNGMPRLLIGDTTSPLVMPLGSPISFTTKYNQMNDRGDNFESVLNRFDAITNPNQFSSYYAHQTKLAGDLSSTLLTAMEQAPDFSTFTKKNTYGQTLFNTGVSIEADAHLYMHDEMRSNIFRQLDAATRMIKVGKDALGYKRQIIYVGFAGFDSHGAQSVNHANNLRSISIAMSDFQKALEEMGMDQEVLTVSMSEFGRTLLNSGDGADHGWGGHSFMMTGDQSFNGGNVFGTVMDDLRLEGVNTYTAKGRMIPTTSVEQMMAPCLKWFGVEDTLMPDILPNLVNFKTDPNEYNSAFLQGVFNT